MATATVTLAEQAPAEIDGQLFPILDRLAQKDSHLADYLYLLGLRGRINQIHGKMEYNDPGVQRKQFEESKAKLEAEIAELEAEAAPFEAEFDRRGGWTRYLVVSGGHLHFRSCHTLTPGRTMVGQIAEASGLDQGEVVGKYGETACTHCFPDAPVAEKKTPAEEGFCEHSGEFVPAEKLPANWMSRIYMPSVRCECGHVGAITKTGKYRKHKAERSAQ
jgi:hypothetical protein